MNKMKWFLMVLGMMLLSFQTMAVDLQLDLAWPFLANPPSNRTVYLYPMSPYQGNVILPSFTNAQGTSVVFSNVPVTSQGGQFNGQISAPPGKITFQLFLLSTDGGLVNASNRTSLNTINTYPAGATAWSIQTSDQRYQLSGTTLSNTFYPLFSNPSNYLQTANPNQYIPGSNITLTTNAGVVTIASTASGGSGSATNVFVVGGTNVFVNVVTTGGLTTNTVQVPTQGFLTNGMGSAAYTASTAYDSSGSAVAVTNTGNLVFTNTFMGGTNQVAAAAIVREIASTNTIGLSSGLSAFVPASNFDTNGLANSLVSTNLGNGTNALLNNNPGGNATAAISISSGGNASGNGQNGGNALASNISVGGKGSNSGGTGGNGGTVSIAYPGSGATAGNPGTAFIGNVVIYSTANLSGNLSGGTNLPSTGISSGNLPSTVTNTGPLTQTALIQVTNVSIFFTNGLSTTNYNSAGTNWVWTNGIQYTLTASNNLQNNLNSASNVLSALIPGGAFIAGIGGFGTNTLLTNSTVLNPSIIGTVNMNNGSITNLGPSVGQKQQLTIGGSPNTNAADVLTTAFMGVWNPTLLGFNAAWDFAILTSDSSVVIENRNLNQYFYFQTNATFKAVNGNFAGTVQATNFLIQTNSAFSSTLVISGDINTNIYVDGVKILNTNNFNSAMGYFIANTNGTSIGLMANALVYGTNYMRSSNSIISIGIRGTPFNGDGTFTNVNTTTWTNSNTPFAITTNGTSASYLSNGVAWETSSQWPNSATWGQTGPGPAAPNMSSAIGITIDDRGAYYVGGSQNPFLDAKIKASGINLLTNPPVGITVNGNAATASLAYNAQQLVSASSNRVLYPSQTVTSFGDTNTVNFLSVNAQTLLGSQQVFSWVRELAAYTNGSGGGEFIGIDGHGYITNASFPSTNSFFAKSRQLSLTAAAWTNSSQVPVTQVAPAYGTLNPYNLDDSTTIASSGFRLGDAVIKGVTNGNIILPAAGFTGTSVAGVTFGPDAGILTPGYFLALGSGNYPNGFFGLFSAMFTISQDTSDGIAQYIPLAASRAIRIDWVSPATAASVGGATNDRFPSGQTYFEVGPASPNTNDSLSSGAFVLINDWGLLKANTPNARMFKMVAYQNGQADATTASNSTGSFGIDNSNGVTFIGALDPANNYYQPVMIRSNGVPTWPGLATNTVVQMYLHVTNHVGTWTDAP